MSAPASAQSGRRVWASPPRTDSLTQPAPPERKPWLWQAHWFAYRFRWPPKGWLAAGIGAVLLAAPNLMTLSIVIGSGSGAHAGQRILDVDAPGFRGGTLVGVLLAIAVMAFWAVTMHMRRRTKRRNDDLEDELRRMEDRRAAEGRDAGR